MVYGRGDGTWVGVFTSNGYQVTWGIILISSLVHCDNDLLTRNSGHRFRRCIAYVLCCLVGRWLSFSVFLHCIFLLSPLVLLVRLSSPPPPHCGCHHLYRTFVDGICRQAVVSPFFCTSCSLRCSTRDVVHSFSSLLSGPGRSTGGLLL